MKSLKKITSAVLSVMMIVSMFTFCIGSTSAAVIDAETSGASQYTKVELVGNINGVTDWSSTAYPFTWVEANSRWELIIDLTSAGSFKARANGAWTKSWGNSSANYEFDGANLGTYLIYATDSGSSLHLVKQSSYSITGLSDQSLTAGESYTFEPVADNGEAVTLSSNNTDVATVDGYTVKAVGAGSAVITATAANCKNATCTVTVSQGNAPITGATILGILNGTKVQYYIGEKDSWGQDNIYVMADSATAGSTSAAVAYAATAANKTTISGTSYRYGAVTTNNVASYYITHGGWASGAALSTLHGGYYYCLTNGTTPSGLTKIGSTTNFACYQAGPTAATTITAGTVATTTTGSTVAGSVSTTYYVSDGTNVYLAGTSDAEATDYLATLEDGAYTVYTTLSDGTITILADTDSYLVTSLETYTITATCESTQGSVTPDTQSVIEGNQATVTATANRGYVFSAWTDNGTTVSTEAAYTFTPDASVDLVAEFVEDTSGFTVSVASSDDNKGTVDGAGYFYSGETATVSATSTSNASYSFESWTVNGEVVSTDASYTFEVTESVNLVANFVDVPTKTIYFCATNGWSTINLYVWKNATGSYSTAYPGAAMTYVEKDTNNNPIYKVDISSYYDMFIFNNGSTQATSATRTLPTDGTNCYEPYGTVWYSYSEPVEVTYTIDGQDFTDTVRPGANTEEAIKEAVVNNAPKINSLTNKYTLTTDDVTINGNTVTAVAQSVARTYDISITNTDTGYSDTKQGKYMSEDGGYLTLSAEEFGVADTTKALWQVETNGVYVPFAYGAECKVYVTSEMNFTVSESDSSTIANDAYVVGNATLDSNNGSRINMNILCIADKTSTEFGMLVVVNGTATEEELTAAVTGSSTGVYKYQASNKNGEGYYTMTMTATDNATNRAKTYYIYAYCIDGNGNVCVSDTYVTACIADYFG